MKRLRPRFTIGEKLKALGILVVVYFTSGALMTWVVEPRHPTLFRWCAFAATFLFLLLAAMGVSEFVKALWWRSGSRDRRRENS
jgi:hypothetical protein